MRRRDERTSDPAPVLRIGGWQVDGDLGRLVGEDGGTVQPEPKALELLLILAESPGRPVSRAELKQRLWQGDHLAPGALKHVVWQLRRDLGDDAKAPDYVETVRGRGYRLIAEVSEDGAAPQKPRLARAAALAMIGGLIVAGGWRLGGVATRDEAGIDPPSSARPVARPLTALPGNEIGPAISPNGSFVIFSWDGGEEGGDFDLYRIATAGGSPEPVVRGSEDELEPAISPDGRWLAYLRGEVGLGGTELLLRDLTTGSEQSLATASHRLLDVAWLDAGRRLVVSERPAAKAPAHLREITVAGSSRQLTEPPPQTSGDLFPALSPDGRSLAFYRLERGSSGQVILFDLESATLEPLETPVGRLVGLAFDASGESLIVSSDWVPPRGLWRVPLNGEPPRWLGLPGSFVAEPASSRSGVVTYQDQRCDSNVWSLSLDESAAQPSRVPSLASTRQDMQAKLSREGDRVALLSNRGGAYRVWIADWPSGSPRPLADEGGPVLSLDWAPGGGRLALAVRETGGVSGVYTVGTEGGGRRRISRPTRHGLAPSWSWDGASLYYSALIRGSWRILRHHLETGLETDLGPGVAAKESPGGDVLFILEAGTPGLSRRRVGEEQTEVVIPFLSTADAESWQPVPGGVVFLHWGRDGLRHLSRWTSKSAETVSLATLDKNLPYPAGLSVSPDERTVLWTRIDAVASDLLVATGPF